MYCNPTQYRIAVCGDLDTEGAKGYNSTHEACRGAGVKRRLKT